MKRELLVFFSILLLLPASMIAQCITDPGTGALQPGLYPEDDADIDGMEWDEPYEFTYQYVNYNSLALAQRVPDSIELLGLVEPSYTLDFVTDKTNNRFTPGEAGCIKVFGTPTSSSTIPSYVDIVFRIRVYIDLNGLVTIDTTSDVFGVSSRINVVHLDSIPYLPSSTRNLNLLSQLSLFPNPTKDKLYIQFTSNQSSDATVHIHDLSGKVIHQQLLHLSLGEGTAVVDVSEYELAQGLYHLSITDGEKFSQQRFIVE